MAPQKPKRPSMLTRQRQLRAQQQQVRSASRNQLPSAGGSSGNSRQARAQRANTTRAQAANNQRIINRGMEGFIRRGQANDKADAAARGSGPSGTTRTAGAGGVLGRPKPSAVTTSNRPVNKPSNQPVSRGGALVRSPGGAVTRPNVQPTRPRGGQIEKAGPTIDVKANTNKLSAGSARPGSNARPALSAGRPGGAIATTTPRATATTKPNSSTAKKLVRGAGSAGLAGALLPAALDARDSILRTAGLSEGQVKAMSTLDRAIQSGGASLAVDAREALSGRPKLAAAKPRTVNGGKNILRGVEGTGRYVSGDMQTEWRAPKPKPRPTPTQFGSDFTPSRGSSSPGSGGSAPRSMPRAVTRSSGPAPDAGMKNQDKNFRGNLFEKTFGYKPGQAPYQSKGNSNQFDTKSDVYTPSTKVDGSQYADKKPDMKKVDEYNRRRRRYYD